MKKFRWAIRAIFAIAAFHLVLFFYMLFKALSK